MNTTTKRMMTTMTDDYRATIHSDELKEEHSTRYLQATRDIAALMMLSAAADSKLSEHNDAFDAGDTEAADRLLDEMKIQITFGSYSATVSLSCMDTYDAFVAFMQEAIYNEDLFGRDSK